MTCEPVPSAPVRRRARRARRWAGRSNRVSEVGSGPGLQAGSSPARLPRAAPDTAARPVRRAAARFELVIVAPWFVYCKFHDWTKTRSAPGTPSSHASSYMPSWATQQPREGGTAVGRKPVTGLVGRIRRRTKTIKREAKESSGLLCILRVLRQRGDGAQCSVPWGDNLESQRAHRRAPPGTPANLVLSLLIPAQLPSFTFLPAGRLATPGSLAILYLIPQSRAALPDSDSILHNTSRQLLFFSLRVLDWRVNRQQHHEYDDRNEDH